jgi:hypothetical protein
LEAGDYIVTTGDDKKIKIWENENLKLRRTFKMQNNIIDIIFHKKINSLITCD